MIESRAEVQDRLRAGIVWQLGRGPAAASRRMKRPHRQDRGRRDDPHPVSQERGMGADEVAELDAGGGL